MKKTIHRILAVILSVAMIASLFTTAFAMGDIKGDVKPDKPEIIGLPGHGENTDSPEDDIPDPWASGSLNVKDETLFPDADLRAYLAAIDADHNGGVSREEAKAYFDKTGGRIDLRFSGFYVKDFTGAGCLGEYVTSLDVGGKDDDPLKIDFKDFPRLEELIIRARALQTELDLRCAPLLKKLDLWGTGLSSLDLSGTPALEYLHVGETGLDQLDLSANPALKTLYAFGNQLTALDLSANPALERIDVESNRLTTLVLTAASCLNTLECRNNPLQSLDLSAAPQLSELYVDGCAITEIDISACPKLKNAYLNGITMSYPGGDAEIIEKFDQDGEIRYNSLQTILTDSLIVRRNPGEAGGDPVVSLVRPDAVYVLPECGFTAPEGKRFAGWQVEDEILQPGDRITVSEDLTVTAVWENLPVQPETPAAPAAPEKGGDVCAFCGETHTGIHGWFVSYFHILLSLFSAVFSSFGFSG